jgi:hypothetical protein
MKGFINLMLVVALALMTGMAFAQGIEVPPINVLEELGKLVLNWNTLPDLMKGSVIVMILVQVVKQAKDFKYKRFLVVALSVLYGVGQMVLGGESLSAAIVAVLVSGGGAIALYEALKPLLKNVNFLKIGK